VIQMPGAAANPTPWSPREAELLEVTLQLLQEHGYERLTLDAVAGTARASKATVYRRWPTKAELVLAAFIEGVRQVAVVPNTGSLGLEKAGVALEDRFWHVPPPLPPTSRLAMSIAKV